MLERLRASGIHITDREMRAICSNELPVMSNSGGYFIPQTIEEVNQFYKQERKRALSIFVRARRVKKMFVESHKVEPKIEYKVDEVGQSAFC